MTAPCVISAGTVIEDFTVHTDWSADAQMTTPAYHMRCLDDPAKRGMYTKHANSATPSIGYVTKTGLSLDLSAMTTLRLDYYMEAFTSISAFSPRLVLEFSSTGDFSAKKMSSSALTTSMNHPGGTGPRRMTLASTDFTATGGDSFSNTMVSMRIGFYFPSYAYGMYHGHYVYFDKLVMNPANTPLVIVGVDTSLKADTDITTPLIAASGFDQKVYADMVDYDNAGDTNYNTMSQLATLAQSGMAMPTCITNWLLQCPRNTDGEALRPSPPFPVYNDDYTGMDDSTANHIISLTNHLTVVEAVEAINDYYGIPKSPYLNPHASLSINNDLIQLLYLAELRFALARADYTSSTNNATIWSSLPVADPYVVLFTMVASSINDHTKITTAIDNTIARGQYLILAYPASITTAWSAANFQTEMEYLRTKEDAGLLTVVSLDEFYEQAFDDTVTALREQQKGYSSSATLGGATSSDFNY